MRAIKYATSGLLTVGLMVGAAGMAAAQTTPSSPPGTAVPNNNTKDPIGGGNVTGAGGMGPSGTHDMNSKKANKAKLKQTDPALQANPPPKTMP